MGDTNQRYINSLLSLVNKTKTIKGDILELGTYKGNNAIIFANIIKKEALNKRYIGIDTFKGYIPYQVEESTTKVSQKNRDAFKKIQTNKFC